MGSYSQNPWATWPYAEANDPFSAYPQYSNYSAYLADSMEAYQTQHHHLVHHHQMSRTTESKPRLSKEEVEILEAEFQKNHKPNSSTKKALAESMRVDNARINNWFQNRRAREKKERNIREYEARQKLEKEKNEPGSASRKYAERNGDLVPSSAPFPNAQGAPQTTTERREPSLGSDHDSEDAAPYLSDENGDVKEIGASSELPKGVFGLPGTEDQMTGFSNGGDYTSPSNGTSDANDADFALSTDEEDPEYYLKHVQAMGGAVNPLYSYEGEELMGFPPTQPSSDGNVLRSPATIDIASRRNRRPPPLAINGARSYSAGIPKTAIDMGRRADAMRRVASATGTMRVTKPMGIPRSPFQASQSPATAVPKGSHAPPTPDTPILANQPATANVANPDSASAISASDLAVRDPTLRTPPTTPGGMQNFFSLNSVYDMPMAEDGFVTPSMAGFARDFNAPNTSMPIGFPHQIANANSCVSQPQTPSFVSPMNPSSFGITGGNMEYAWPDSMMARNPSPAEQQRTSQFLNVPTPGFGMGS